MNTYSHGKDDTVVTEVVPRLAPYAGQKGMHHAGKDRFIIGAACSLEFALHDPANHVENDIRSAGELGMDELERKQLLYTTQGCCGDDTIGLRSSDDLQLVTRLNYVD